MNNAAEIRIDSVPSDGFDESFHVLIASDPTQGQEIQDRIISLMERYEFSARDVFCTRLALAEGVTNAIRHGNRMDPGKQVSIFWAINEQKVRVVIKDEGSGFDTQDLIDPTMDENLERPGGRGIMLMRSFMDALDYSERGTQLTIEKLRSPAND